MQKKLITSAIILSVSFALSGCSKSPTEKIGEKFGEKMVENTIESQTGGQVDIDTSGGTMRFSDENGATEVSTGSDVALPDNFPKELVVAEDAMITLASDLGIVQSVAYESNIEKKDLTNSVIAKLTNDGWKKTLEMDAGTSMMLNFEKDGKRANFLISDNESEDAKGKTIVSITLSENKD